MTPELIAAVGAVSPRELAGVLLGYVVKVLGAKGGVVVAFQFGCTHLYVDRVDGDMERVSLAMATWQKRQDELASGVFVDCGNGGSMSPLLSDGGLVGAVYLDGVPTSRCDIREIAPLLVAAIRAPCPGAGIVEEMFRSTPVEEFERAKILRLLHGNEWNVSRVARIIGITRRTVYQRMDRYGIPRQKVSRQRGRREPARA